LSDQASLLKNRKLQRRTLQEVAQGRVRKGKAQRGEAAELEELQVDTQQQRVNREMMREMKPEPLQSLQLVAQPAEIAQETLKCIFFRENFRKL
jgi:hypothetical protein